MAEVVSIDKYVDDELKAELQSMLTRETCADIRSTIKDILIGATKRTETAGK
jgi:hypothetical protein